MNRNTVQGNLKELKGKVREKWGWWTHQYSSVLTGRVHQWVGKLQSMYGRLKK